MQSISGVFRLLIIVYRWINEILYTSRSVDGRKLIQDDPKLFEEVCWFAIVQSQN